MSLKATVKEYLTVRKEGSREVKKPLNYYNLDMIISVGYRIKSHVAARFRIWATERLKEYIMKNNAYLNPGWFENSSARYTSKEYSL